ncbi:MAG: fused MFS/spermidine synthase [Proteobacteria bacterium]|nr:fused MFS/spermidine synthase [Pseudomonadota bacterium]
MTTADSRARALFLTIACLFLLSGATSLVYQVTWMRMLSLLFGSDVYAAAITLAVFMSGLSVGSWLSGRMAARLRRPLLAYGILELAIGAYALLFPALLESFEPAIQSVYRGWFEVSPVLYHACRIAIASGTLLVPTLLMGATLPLIVQQFGSREAGLGNRVGVFYAVNTVGALGGTLLAGFVALPLLGVTRTTLGAVTVNGLIGLGAVLLALRVSDPTARAPAGRGAEQRAPLTRLQRAAVAVMALSGFAALALEVVWMRVLVQSFSATVYAFSIMLACFLLGIAWGSREAARIVDRHPSPARLLATLELWLGAGVAALAVLTHLVPGFFGALVWTLTEATGGFGAASVVAQFAAAGVLILGPTVLLGATFPVAVVVFTRDIELRARGTGVVYAANTAGAVLGSLDWVARRDSREAVPALSARTRWGSLAVIAVSALVYAALPPQTVINFNLQQSSAPELLFHGESGSHSLDVVRNEDGDTVMMINGNIESDTTFTQRRHFILKAHLPLMLHPDPRDVAVVGLGLGITLAATERHPTVETIQLIELSPLMLEAHAVLRELTGGVLESPKMRVRIDDGRNFMAYGEGDFDMITADPVHPRITGVGTLYTREYYELIRDRLRPGGTVIQWMPMYRISKTSFDVAFRTFAAVFPHASFWYVGGHGLFVATADPFRIDYEVLAQRFAHPAVGDDLRSIGIDSPEILLAHLLMDTEHIRRYLAQNGGGPLNTDDNAYLEYRTPFEFIEGPDDIVPGLVAFAGWNADALLVNAPAEARATIQQLFAERLGRIEPELTELRP